MRQGRFRCPVYIHDLKVDQNFGEATTFFERLRRGHFVSFVSIYIGDNAGPKKKQLAVPRQNSIGVHIHTRHHESGEPISC